VYRYLRQSREGDLSAKSPPGRKATLDEVKQKLLLKQLEAKADFSLREHAELYAKDNGVVLAGSTIDSYFTRLGIRRKKDLSS
jgi:transposase